MKILKAIGKIIAAVVFGWIFWAVPSTLGFFLWASYKPGITFFSGAVGSLALAAGLAFGIRFFESAAEKRECPFLNVFAWTLPGVIVGCVVGRMLTPAFTRILNYIFLFGILSVVAREILNSVKRKGL